jgi:acyl dehydratase
MARAILTPRRPGLRESPPALAARWSGHRVSGSQLDAFLSLTGLDGHRAWPLLYPHVAGFRLVMVLLTERTFPLPIWRALQVRNSLALERAFERGAALDFEARVGAQRVLEKGVEIDVRCTARSAGELVWHSVNSFYYRGGHGAAGAQATVPAAPQVEEGGAVRWTAPEGGAVGFGRLTGDYNGIHLARRYAQLFGFKGAFLHPQRVLGQCLAHLQRPVREAPLRLEAWLKGPVYYGSALALRSAPAAAETAFALHVNGDARPAIVACLYG